MLPRATVDEGAIRFVLRGANVMCVGLTSAGGCVPEGLVEGDAVAIFAEGKEHPIGVGIMTMSAADILEKNSGVGIEAIHHVGDGLWFVEEIAE